ncbi:unnamed protein product, partial [Musa textilis]
QGAQARLLGPTARFDGGGVADLPDLSEDDVWSAVLTAGDDHQAFSAAMDDGDHHDLGRARTGLTGARRWADRHVGGLSLALEDAYPGAPVPHRPYERHRVVSAAASAPVDVPAWAWALQTDSGGPSPEREEEDADGEWLPPHEYLARAHGRSLATSVLEGAGRTLKGRDMSRVRDAVWSQTGFSG